MSDDRPTLDYERRQPPPRRNRYAELAFGRFGPRFTWEGFARDLALATVVVAIVALSAFAFVLIRN